MNTEINVFLQAQQFGQNATQQILEKKSDLKLVFQILRKEAGAF